MDKILLILCALVGLGMTLLSYPEGAISVLLILTLSVPAIILIRFYSEEKTFLTIVFLSALLVRICLGLLIHIFELRNTFGPDAFTYDAIAQNLVESWRIGLQTNNDFAIQSPGWGMSYLVGFIYLICGQSMLVAQTFCAVIGAATAPIIYFCAKELFNNKKVSQLSAWFIALFPSLVIWSSQLLKDGIIIFLLVLTMTIVMQLQKKLNYGAIFVLVFCLFGILSLRFYIFYMVAVSVAGSFIVGFSPSVKSIVRNFIAVVLIGLALTYLGVIKDAGSELENFASLKNIQYRRQALVKNADSGFGEDLDVSTPVGAVSAIPIGFAYLMFSPFPWEITKYSQLLVLPETLIWWMLIPILISGLIFSFKKNLKKTIPILLFSIMLTLSYSIFQGNVGMAYRQRTQIQVFLFIFVAVGITLFQERKENKKLLLQAKNREIERRLRLNFND